MLFQQICILWFLLVMNMKCSRVIQRAINEYSDDNRNIAKKSINDDDTKTLSQQILEGKYGLIHKELFSKPIERPGILSYATSKDLPNDNRVSLGGLQKNDIWFSKDHLLIIKGGSFPIDTAQKTVWSPISNYNAPKHEILLPENPEVPPPFPVQFYDKGPIIYIKKNISNDTHNVLNKNELEPILIKPINQSMKQVEEEVDEDPSIYYPQKYSFYFQNKNKSLVAPGPIVPGIVLPPPPDFFGILKLTEPTTISTTIATTTTTINHEQQTTTYKPTTPKQKKSTTTTTESLTQIYPTYYPTKVTSKSLSDSKQKFYDLVDNSIIQEDEEVMKTTRSSNQTFILTINDDLYDNSLTFRTTIKPTITYPLKNFIESTTRYFIKKRNYNHLPKIKSKINPITTTTLYVSKDPFLVNNNNNNNNNNQHNDNIATIKNYILVPLNNHVNYFQSNIENLKTQLNSHLNYQQFEQTNSKPIYQYSFEATHYKQNNPRLNTNLLNANQIIYHQQSQPNNLYERPYHKSYLTPPENYEDNYFEIFGKRLESGKKSKYNNYYNNEIVNLKNSIREFVHDDTDLLQSNLKPLHNDIDINFKKPLPSINPQAELIEPTSFHSTKISYQLPGNGAHVYFYTPYRKPTQFNNFRRRQHTFSIKKKR